MENPSEIFSSERLQRAWQSVKDKGKAGGIDKISVNQFDSESEKLLSDLRNELLTLSYAPEPYLRFFIKKDSGEYRPLALSSIKDKIVQRTVMDYYEPAIDKRLSMYSFAYRKSKSHLNAIDQVQRLVKKEGCFVGLLDIDDFFDNIDRKILASHCRDFIKDEYVINLIRMWTEIGVVWNRKYIENPKGIAQGGIISPMLSNIYLNSFDQVLLRKHILYIRYADNVFLIHKSMELLEKNFNFCRDYLKTNLNLTLNESKCQLLPVKDGFTFCGIHFVGGKRIIDPAKFLLLKEKLSAVREEKDFNIFAQKINETIRGIKHYFSKFDVTEQFSELEKALAEGMTGYINSLLKTKAIRKISTVKKIIRSINLIKSRSFNERQLFENLVISKLDLFSADSAGESAMKQSMARKKRKYIEQYYKSVDVIVVKKGSQLGVSKNKLLISTYGKPKREVPADKLKNLMISTEGVSITSNAVKLCCEMKISLNFVDFFGKPYGVLLSHNSPYFSVSMKQTEACSGGKGKSIAINIVKGKVRNQIAVLRYFIKNREEIDGGRKFIDDEIQQMEKNLAKLDSIDRTAERDDLLNTILGIEGICAVSYWKCFRGLLPDELDFPGRETKGSDDPVNMLINYGYGILYNRVLNSVMVNGLNPHIAFLHREQKQKPTLVFDLIEQFRAPVVDRTVIAALRRKMKIKIEKNFLDDSTRQNIAGKVLARLNSELTYGGRKITYNDLIFVKTKELVKHIKGEVVNYCPYIFKW
jgi:group II intron reverse transcriptase/maturase/CRISPR-associated endonuclease Cas1